MIFLHHTPKNEIKKKEEKDIVVLNMKKSQ